ncbi:DUF4132 domain-containing protein [Planobispora takensis]|uniref:DUF4132 domain-containing protein n=1 Tax=Planobispora takensis TaxID=1367882 RepID=A0A8J3WXI8_9ACTN|nr:DUF4132 domain-containing protein [Planobispora takensis]GII05981.1 hypothetical protein Pta02_79890 [Planobispora takensis]
MLSSSPDTTDATDASSAFEFGALLVSAYRSRDAGTPLFAVRQEALQRQALFTPETCAELFDVLAVGLHRGVAYPCVAAGALARCPAGAPTERLAGPARTLVEFLLRRERLEAPFAVLALAGLAGLDAEVTERILEGCGPIGVAQVRLLLGWSAEHRALFAESVREATDHSLTPLPGLYERLDDLPGYPDFARATIETAEAHVAAIHAGEIPYRAEKAFDDGEKRAVGRAVRLALLRDEPWLPESLDGLLRGIAVAPTRARTLPSQGLLFEIARAVEEYPTPEAVSSLRTARRITRHAGVPRQLDRMFKRIERALADRLEVAFRLPDGRVRQAVGEHTAVISIEDGVELSWWHGERRLKTVPAAVRRDHPEEVKRLRELAKQTRQQQVTLVRALEAGYIGETLAPYRQLEGHPITDRLIWEFEVSPGVWRSELGMNVPEVPVRLWHPARVSPQEVRLWREAVQEGELRQPFKQAFREVYLLTPAEERTRDHSRRFADHLLRYGQAKALLTDRGWTGMSLGYWDLECGSDQCTAVKKLPGGLTARWDFHLGEGFGERDGYGTASTCVSGDIRFTGERGAAVPLAEIDPLVLSETLRDADLAVGVTSTGLDPHGRGEYWQSYGFGELTESARVRRDALARLLPRLAIADRCTLTDRFLVVRGDLRTYKIHLRSGNILMEPNDAYLCIVPGRGASDRLFLPFEEDGGLLSVIVSKAFLLADDTAVTDPSITHQIRGRAETAGGG